MIEGSKTIYYSSDTAYNKKMFKSIGKSYSNIDFGIVPIEAYKPNWFMSSILVNLLVNPSEAVKMHLDVKSKNAVAANFQTFALVN